jgi:hypothetical protein
MRYSPSDKPEIIRVVEHEGIASSMYYGWSKEFQARAKGKKVPSKKSA